MQEDRKLRSDGLALRRHRLLKEMILHVLGQIAPDPNDCIAERARKLIFGGWIGGWHLNYSRRPGAGMFNRHRRMGKTKVRSGFCSANIFLRNRVTLAAGAETVSGWGSF
jgi:hypothetical protein